jgi:uncharacterized protein (TIGR03084 family)
VADPVDALLADLAAEQQELLGVVAGVGGDDWFRVTPAKGWDVRDTVAHLADTDELAIDTCTGGARALNEFAATLASPADTTLWGVLAGRRRTGREVREWWASTQSAERDVLGRLDPSTRVPWGLGMRVPSFLTARLMETWAHGLDIRAALGVDAHDTPRLRQVAWLAIRALPYAFGVAGRSAPSGPLRVELTGPEGDVWPFGPEDAPDRITGPAGEFCRVFVQRLALGDARGLRVEGAGAESSLEVARAYL